MPICSFEKEKKSHWNNVDFFSKGELLRGLIDDPVQFEMSPFSSAFDHLHGKSVIGTLKFWGHPLLSEPTKNKPVNWHFARPGWCQVRMTINKTGT